MTYSIDLKERVLNFVQSGGSKAEAARLFSVSRVAIYKWLNRKGDLAPRPAKTRQRLLDKEALRRDVAEHPDDFLRERAARLGVSVPAIWYALNAMKIVKKTASLRRAR
jgi:transposase